MGKRYTTKALSSFVVELEERPIFARVAKDSIASIRVLEKCGIFLISGYDKGFADAHGEKIEEVVMVHE